MSSMRRGGREVEIQRSMYSGATYNNNRQYLFFSSCISNCIGFFWTSGLDNILQFETKSSCKSVDL